MPRHFYKSVARLLNPCHMAPYIFGKYGTSLWLQMPLRQVGAEESVDIMVFPIQCNISPSKYASVLTNVIEILPKADDTIKCLFFNKYKQHVKRLNHSTCSHDSNS